MMMPCCQLDVANYGLGSCDHGFLVKSFLQADEFYHRVPTCLRHAFIEARRRVLSSRGKASSFN